MMTFKDYITDKYKNETNDSKVINILDSVHNQIMNETETNKKLDLLGKQNLYLGIALSNGNMVLEEDL